ncbi:cilia- and flagella-associated protein 77 [Betta splendens]|uniref:Cilia- and flagella-associated protein 77 n=1 Tax=Betta splendens TaxID=158456 RepID=A0A6P7NHJ4_BETSP|nr:cilia- and flagella-associated protein 77 [Betta splendens]
MTSRRLGVVRESMLTNPLHIKASLGQTQSRGLSFPGPDFTFGISSKSIRDGGVAEVLSSWRVQPRHTDSALQMSVTRDFVSLNRDAVKSGLVTPKELSQYRAQRAGVTRTKVLAPRREQGSRAPVVPDITFGVRTRASSPLKDLLSHQYSRRWFDEQMSKSRTVDQSQLHIIRAGCIPDTRTSLLRRGRTLPVTQTPFKLPHFSQVLPALDTFRTQEARLRAFRAHQSKSGFVKEDVDSGLQTESNTSTLVQIK